jgi:hypothetical protein
MTPIPIQRPYNNWLAVSRVMATIRTMLVKGHYTPSRAMVLITIAGHCNQDDGISLASYDMLWTEAGIPRRTASAAVTRLVTDGYLRHISTWSFALGPEIQTFIAEAKPSGGRKQPASIPEPPPQARKSLLNVV